MYMYLSSNTCGCMYSICWREIRNQINEREHWIKSILYLSIFSSTRDEPINFNLHDRYGCFGFWLFKFRLYLLLICLCNMSCVSSYHLCAAVAVAQSVRAFPPQAEGWVFKSQLRQPYVADSSIAKYLVIGMSVTGPRR